MTNLRQHFDTVESTNYAIPEYRAVNPLFGHLNMDGFQVQAI